LDSRNLKTMKLTRNIRLVLFFIFVITSWQANAAPLVVELTAAELPVFVKQHDTVIVQMISSDPKCGGCPGADKKFDQLAAKRYSKPVVFARVNWAVWSDFPKFDAAIRLFSAPVQLFFKGGEQVDSIEVNFTDVKDIADTEAAIEEFVSRNPSSIVKVFASLDVIELQPAQLPAFLMQNPSAVVQFLSSDLNCGFCISAAYTFDSAAKHRTDKKVMFARVQWGKPWRNIPQFGGTFSISGIPSQIVFYNGIKVGGFDGKPPDRNVIYKAMNEAFEKIGGKQ
jgi:hypothetical protein